MILVVKVDKIEKKIQTATRCFPLSPKDKIDAKYICITNLLGAFSFSALCIGSQITQEINPATWRHHISHCNFQTVPFSPDSANRGMLVCSPEQSSALPWWEFDVMDTPSMSHTGRPFAPAHKANRLLGGNPPPQRRGRCDSWATRLDR